MAKKIGIVILAFLCILPIATMVVKAESDIVENDETGIPDKELYESVLGTLRKKKNEKFTKREAENIKSLDIRYYDKVKSFQGIGYLKNLTNLELSGIKDSDLEVIAKELSNLKKLTIEGYEEETWTGAFPVVAERQNKISSLKPLKTMKKLEFLKIPDNNLSSLEGIEGLKKLKTLLANSNQITNIEKVKNLFNLTKLDLSNNNLSNVKGIGTLKNLRTLNVSENNLKSLGEIKKLKKLKELYVMYNKLENIKGIRNLKNLKTLYLSGNRLKAVGEIKYLKKVKVVSLYNNQINKLPNLKALNNMKMLKTLDVDDNELKKLPNLKKLKGIELSLSWNYLSKRELKNKLPKKWYSTLLQKRQKSNIKITYITPRGKTNITKDTTEIVGKVTPTTIEEEKFLPEFYLRLPDGKMAGWDGKMGTLPMADADGIFRIEGLDLRAYAGQEVELIFVIDYDLGEFTIDRFIIHE